jgi:hypothetical protein
MLYQWLNPFLPISTLADLTSSGGLGTFHDFSSNNAETETRSRDIDLEKEMKELREMRRMVTSSDMDGEEKKNLLITLGRAENNLTANIQTVKKVIASAK